MAMKKMNIEVELYEHGYFVKLRKWDRLIGSSNVVAYGTGETQEKAIKMAVTEALEKQTELKNSTKEYSKRVIDNCNYELTTKEVEILTK